MLQKDFYEKTRRSAIVFNTPSVLGCHGWKLAEYLAMGKAIISTPLNNIMPGDNSVPFLTVTTNNEINEAVKYLHNNEPIKKPATRYFEKFLAPEAVIKIIFSKLTDSSAF